MIVKLAYTLMTKFLTEQDLNPELAKLISTGKQKITLISPVINLHERFISIMKKKLDNYRFKITLVFGRNEGDISKSMNVENFDFFRQFRNIEIRHQRWLHTDYYANESSAILTSMNLYDYSHDNNLETGIFLNRSLFRLGLDASPADDAWRYFETVVKQAKVVFRKTPKFKKTYFGLSKRYVDSTVDIDDLSHAYAKKQFNGNGQVQLNDIHEKSSAGMRVG